VPLARAAAQPAPSPPLSPPLSPPAYESLPPPSSPPSPPSAPRADGAPTLEAIELDEPIAARTDGPAGAAGDALRTRGPRLLRGESAGAHASGAMALAAGIEAAVLRETLGIDDDLPAAEASAGAEGEAGGAPSAVAARGVGSYHNYWGGGGIVVLPAPELLLLERTLEMEGATTSASLLRRLRALGAAPPTTVAEGAPLNARVAYADAPRFHGLSFGANDLDFGVVTTDEVQSAFELLAAEGVPGHARADVVRRAVTCPLLLRRPLDRAQAEQLFKLVGVDGRGLISCARFNGQLNVLPPMPKDPPRPGCLRRCADGVLRRLPFGKAQPPAGEYGVADVSDDGTLTNRDGLRPIAL
jgi:hypothetical protein